MNVAADKNFEGDVRDKVRGDLSHFSSLRVNCVHTFGRRPCISPAVGRGSDSDVVAESVSGSHLAITTAGLTYPIQRLRLLEYQDLL